MTRNNALSPLPGVTFIVLAAVLVVGCTAQGWQVGHGSRPITPPVGGSIDYVQPLPSTDCCSAGTFVKKFDFGQIAVGNGAAEAHWVRDVLKVRAAAIGPDPSGKTSIFVAAEVYMLFFNDLDQYYDAMRERVGEAEYANLLFFVHAHHNHEGPDTSGLSARPINHEFYTYMIGQMVDATVDALEAMGSSVFYYGLGDIRDPRMQDARVRVLRAYGNDSSTPFLTMVQWGMHPEVTLGFSPEVDPKECEQLPFSPDTDCAKNAVFTHDYPGHFSARLIDLYGGEGEAMYFNGAIGCQVGNHGPVWEVDEAHPLGNGGTVPDGADIVPENYRRAYMIGTQLAEYVFTIEDNDTPLPYVEFDYREQDAFVRVTNFLFRVRVGPSVCAHNSLPVGLVPANAINPFADPTRPFRIGDTLREAYICEPHVQPSLETCKSDNFEFLYDSVTKLPFRVGQYMRSVVKYLGLGPLKILTIPGELAPELGAGLPQDFDDPAATSKYFANPEQHATGKDYVVPGVVMDMMQCDDSDPCWLLGLTQDEVGYMFPISDWRVLCTADADECNRLFEMGVMNYTDSMAGSTCRNIIEFPSLARADYVAQFGEDVWKTVNSTCTYGQAKGKAQDHYEETNAASWDIAAVYIDAVATLLGTNPSGRFCTTNLTCAGMVPSPAAGADGKQNDKEMVKLF